MDDPETWRWIWLIATALLVVAEIAAAGSLVALPLALGAGAATVLAFAGVGLAPQWLAFVAVSAVAFAALRPLAKRLDREGVVEGIGSNRLIGSTGTVLTAIPAGDLGTVRVDREEWRAETPDGSPLEVGAPVRVLEVRGTRVVVWPADQPHPLPPSGAGSGGLDPDPGGAR